MVEMIEMELPMMGKDYEKETPGKGDGKERRDGESRRVEQKDITLATLKDFFLKGGNWWENERGEVLKRERDGWLASWLVDRGPAE